MEKVTALGKYLFSIPALGFGVIHLMNANAMAAMAPIPGGAIWIYITGVCMIAAAISIYIGKLDKLATVLLALLLLIYAFSIHFSGALAGDQASTGNFLKDLGLAGGALMYAHSLAKDKGIIG